MSVATKGTVSSQVTMESVLPESKLHQIKYDKAVKRGRHPVTFPRKSELWTLCNNSSRRVDQMSKGRKLWNVVEEDTMSIYNHDDDLDNKSVGSQGTVSTMGNGSISHGSMQPSPIKGLSVNFKLPPGVNSNVNNGISVNSQMNIVKINGFPIDLDAQVPITLGKKIVIMNYMGEFLCVDKNDVVKVKHRKAIELTDKICFRIINLNGYDDTRPILYGSLANLWLQIVEKNSDKDDYLWTYGYVLGSKAFESPLMQNLDNNITNQPKIEKKDNQVLRTASLGVIASKAQLAKKLGVSLRGRRQALMKGATILVKRGKADEKEQEKDEGEESGSDDEKVAPPSSNNHEGPKVCGGVVPIRIVETTKSEAHDVDSLDSGGGQVKEHASKFFSQKSFNFGKFLIYSGLRDDSSIAVNSVVKSQQPVYLVQDLYCLSSSTGTNFAPWPLHADDFDVPSMDSSNGSRPNTAQAIASMKLRHNKNKHGKEPVSIINSIEGAFGVEHSRNKNDDDDDDMFSFTDVSVAKKSVYPTSYGCVRKIEKKGPPFEHVLDRRCIWKFCIIDVPEQQTTSTQMTTRDKEAIECMNIALKKLKISDKKRKGGRQYSGAKYNLPDDITLPSGDRFPTVLRSTVSTNVLLSEAKHFSPTRTKERVLRDFYASKMIQDGDSIYEKKGRRKSKKYTTDSDTLDGTNASDDDSYTIHSEDASSNKGSTSLVSKNKLKLDPIENSPVKPMTKYKQIPLCNENKTSGEIIKAIHDVLGYVSAKVDNKLYNEELGKKVDKPDPLKKVEIDEAIIQERIQKLEESDSFLLQCASYKDRLSSIQKIAAVSMAFKK